MPRFQADVHLKVNNIMERMLVINKDSLKSWAKGIVKANYPLIILPDYAI